MYRWSFFFHKEAKAKVILYVKIYEQYAFTKS